MTVNFYKTFSKRKNSTKQPAVSDTFDAIDCKLKEDCSIENPSFIISQRKASASGNPITVNAQHGDMINPVVTLNVIQEGSGTPTPSNPRHIGAYGDARIHVNSDTTIISFGSAVYGGTLDVTTGVLTVKYSSFKLSDYTWTMDPNYPGVFVAEVTPAKPMDYSFICEQFTSKNATTSTFVTGDGKFLTTPTRTFLYLCNTAFNNANDFMASIDNVTLCYELATYQTVQLTPEQIALFQGTNVITTNGNSSIAFSYKKDKIDLTYTYVQVPDFNRYYFVSNVIVLSNNRVEYVLECDPLASFKSNIGSTVARIAFSTTGWDKDIIDPRMGVETTKLKYQRSVATELSSGGCYILTVFNDDSVSSNGLGCTYVLQESEIGKVKSWMSNTSVITALRNFFGGNPIESIFSCIWVPFPYASAPQVAAFTNMKIGDQNSSNEGVTINNKVLADTGIYKATQLSLEIPYRYNDFRDSEPYTSAQIYLPGVGYTPINIGDWLDTVYMKIDYSMEYATGDLTYYLKDFNDNLIQTISCNVASQCPLGQMLTSGGGIVSSVGGMVGGAAAVAVGAATGNALMATGGVGAMIAGAANTALNANKRAASVKGNQGGRTSTEIRDIIFTGFYMDTEDVDNTSYKAVKGRPVGVSHAISNHSGYVQCDDASVNIGGTALERQRINDYLNAGFFYE